MSKFYVRREHGIAKVEGVLIQLSGNWVVRDEDGEVVEVGPNISALRERYVDAHVMGAHDADV